MLTTEATLAPQRPLGFTPIRRAHSIRRTSTLDTDWPEGREGAMRVHGRARDLITPSVHDSPLVVHEHHIEARISQRREILELTSDQDRPTLGSLIGVRAGGHLRSAIAEALPDDRQLATPLHLLLDDLAGASLVANWIWSRWVPNWREYVKGLMSSGFDRKPMLMEGVCTGFAPGSSALNADGTPNVNLQNYSEVLDLRNPEDSSGWHVYVTQPGPSVRRARSTELWLDGDVQVDLRFQDSGALPSGGRAAVHEYQVSATVDRDSLRLLTLAADPRVLPFAECPSATRNIAQLIGRPVGDFRTTVIDLLPGVLGCTHLNDVLRSLADVPALLEALDAGGNC